MTSKRLVLASLFASAVFMGFSVVAFAAEPFLVDDFEAGLGRWYGGGGGGAQNGILEETKEAHDGKKAMKITLMESNAGWTLVQCRGRAAEFSKLGDSGYEAVNFWFMGLVGTDKTPVRLHMTGAGDHSKDNRWENTFTAPLDEWILVSMPFKDMKPWNQEKRPFAIENIDYFGFFNAAIPWPNFEFIVDQIEFGPITKIEPESVEPSEKLSVCWGSIKEQ